MPVPAAEPESCRSDAHAQPRTDRARAPGVLFATEGIEASVEAITRAAGVGMGTFYRHFPTKEDLDRRGARGRLRRSSCDLPSRRSTEPDPWTGLCMPSSSRPLVMHADNRGLKDVLATREHGRRRARRCAHCGRRRCAGCRAREGGGLAPAGLRARGPAAPLLDRQPGDRGDGRRRPRRLAPLSRADAGRAAGEAATPLRVPPMTQAQLRRATRARAADRAR